MQKCQCDSETVNYTFLFCSIPEKESSLNWGWIRGGMRFWTIPHIQGIFIGIFATKGAYYRAWVFSISKWGETICNSRFSDSQKCYQRAYCDRVPTIPPGERRFLVAKIILASTSATNSKYTVFCHTGLREILMLNSLAIIFKERVF